MVGLWCRLDSGAVPHTMVGMATTYEKLRADIVTAMKARDAGTLMVLRTADAAIQRAASDGGKPLDEALVVRDAAQSGQKPDRRQGGVRPGRADGSGRRQRDRNPPAGEYLPAGLDAARVEALVVEAIKATGAQSKKDMGKVIGALKQRPEAPLIDFGAVSKIVQAKLPPEIRAAAKTGAGGRERERNPGIRNPKSETSRLKLRAGDGSWLATILENSVGHRGPSAAEPQPKEIGRI